MFQIEGRDVLFDWLEHESDPEQRDLMLSWLADLAQSDDPTDDAWRVPGIRSPVYIALTPVRNVFVKFLFVPQFFAIKLIEFDTLP